MKVAAGGKQGYPADSIEGSRDSRLVHASIVTNRFRTVSGAVNEL